jgi:hypothetical protein
MTVPLDRLYHYIESVAQDIRGDAVIIYRFYPHGSKKIEDLAHFKDYSPLDVAINPQIYCNDQEPLDYNSYLQINRPRKFKDLMIKYGVPVTERNFQTSVSIYDKWILVHSEKRSANLAMYENNRYVGVYYWAHAVIAMDWFRYARYDKIIKNAHTKKFLIYNRAWSGTREYRLKLVELLIQANLIGNCLLTLNPVEPELKIHYSNYKFNNPQWAPTCQLENYVVSKEVPSSASADYEIDDYNSSDFELVLETLFDDNRLHLTEKILRPIALGQPFLLAATHGSLEYLRSYGFKTFASVIDETYDLIEDPGQRLESIIASMKDIAAWGEVDRAKKMIEINQITDYNRQHFFSKQFNCHILNELSTNLKTAIDKIEATNTSNIFINYRIACSKHHELKLALLQLTPQHDTAKILSCARYYYNKNHID